MPRGKRTTFWGICCHSNSGFGGLEDLVHSSPYPSDRQEMVEEEEAERRHPCQQTCSSAEGGNRSRGTRPYLFKRRQQHMSKDAAVNTDHKGAQRAERWIATTTRCCSEMVLPRWVSHEAGPDRRPEGTQAKSHICKFRGAFDMGTILSFWNFLPVQPPRISSRFSPTPPEDRTEQNILSRHTHEGILTKPAPFFSQSRFPFWHSPYPTAAVSKRVSSSVLRAGNDNNS